MLASATEFESAIQNLNGVWDVGLAVEGAPPLAYHHILNVSEGRILATPRPSGGLLEEFLDAVGELLRVSRTTIPDTDERTCRFPSDLWNRPLEVVVSPSGARITSGCGLAFSCAHHRLNDVDVFVSDGGEDGVQLMRMGDDGHCSTVPWRMRRGYARLSKDTAVIAVELISTINNESCHSVLDGQRRPRMRTTASTAPPLTSALLIAFAVMLRATKRWWGHAKAKPQPRRQNLTPEVRRELLRRQREIIAKMKEEDRLEQSRNPPHMKAAADSK